jgi:hypothetical protein
MSPPKAPAPQGPDLGFLWPASFPKIGAASAREELTESLRRERPALGLDGVPGLNGEAVSKAIALLPKHRELPGVIVFEIESGPFQGLHRCEALGRGKTSPTPKGGWARAVVREPDGRKTGIYYAPGSVDGGATLPGIYELRNIRPKDYWIKFLNKDVSGDEELVRRLTEGDQKGRPYYSGVWKTWYPRDPRYADVVPVDMIWSERYQPLSQGAGMPIYENTAGEKDPEQTRHNPRYYFGPYGRSGFAVHTDRWSDAETASDPARAAKDEFRSFLFRDTNGCMKVRPDCLQLLNAFIDDQSGKGRRVLLDVREVR